MMAEGERCKQASFWMSAGTDLVCTTCRPSTEYRPPLSSGSLAPLATFGYWSRQKAVTSDSAFFTVVSNWLCESPATVSCASGCRPSAPDPLTVLAQPARVTVRLSSRAAQADLLFTSGV